MSLIMIIYCVADPAGCLFRQQITLFYNDRAISSDFLVLSIVFLILLAPRVVRLRIDINVFLGQQNNSTIVNI